MYQEPQWAGINKTSLLLYSYHGTFNEPFLKVMYVQPLEETPDMTGS